MDKFQAKNSIKNIQKEATSLNPSALVDLYEIDLINVANERGIVLNQGEDIFRFHNQVKLLDSKIVWNNQEYISAPIQAEGFNKTSQGTLPTPILRISVSEEGISLLAVLKEKIRLFGDLVGCKVTRIRTFAKFLKITNFNNNNTPFTVETDEYAEMPREIYFINRKTRENKFTIEYELASILDIEGINLPKRQIISKRCNFNYRGEGCNYEKNDRRDDNIHGEFTVLPNNAPPIATEEDKLITDVLNITNLGDDKGKFIYGTYFNIGDFCYIESSIPAISTPNSTTQGKIKYYFVAKRNGQLNNPPNTSDWIADKCSKCIKACKLRFDTDGSVDVFGTTLTKGHLPFGGFPSIERLRGNQ